MALVRTVAQCVLLQSVILRLVVIEVNQVRPKTQEGCWHLVGRHILPFQRWRMRADCGYSGEDHPK